MLLQRLRHRYGIRGSALDWFTSYFNNRQQSVVINKAISPLRHVNTGVPQGSVLGPLCFTLYTAPLEDIISSHNIKYKLYADDVQLYVTMAEQQRPTIIPNIESCISQIKSWSSINMLKLNDNKTEALHITSKHPTP